MRPLGHGCIDVMRHDALENQSVHMQSNQSMTWRKRNGQFKYPLLSVSWTSLFVLNSHVLSHLHCIHFLLYLVEATFEHTPQQPWLDTITLDKLCQTTGYHWRNQTKWPMEIWSLSALWKGCKHSKTWFAHRNMYPKNFLCNCYAKSSIPFPKRVDDDDLRNKQQDRCHRANGPLSWQARETRIDISGITAFGTQRFPNPNVQHLKLRNKSLKEAYTHKNCNINIRPMDPAQLSVIRSDAAGKGTCTS